MLDITRCHNRQSYKQYNTLPGYNAYQNNGSSAHQAAASMTRTATTNHQQNDVCVRQAAQHMAHSTEGFDTT